jgi:hypothetical protein
MAIKVFDGFDHYGSQADLQARSQGNGLQWSDIPGGGITGFVAGRGGYGFAAAVAGGLNPVAVGCSFNANFASAIVGIATLTLPVDVPYVDYMLMDYVGGSVQITLRAVNDGGVILAYSGDPNLSGAVLLGSSPPNAFSPYVWNKVEVSVTIGASGSFDLHYNGNSVLALSGVSCIAPPGQAATPSNYFNGFKVRFGGAGTNASPQGYIDDFNLNDLTTGPGTYPANSFLGDVATRTLKTAANYSVTWTPLTGANWMEVGAIQFVGDGSYNYAVTVGDIDLFTFSALPTTVSAVFAVQITGAYRKLDASAQTIIQQMNSAGTTSAGATWVLSLGYTYLTDLFVLDPNTGATWTPAAVDAVIAGYKLNS